jgi:hypothetical protein
MEKRARGRMVLAEALIMLETKIRKRGGKLPFFA